MNINSLRWIFWTKIMPLRALIYLRDELFNDCNRHRQIRRFLFGVRMCPFFDFFNFYMNDEKAEFIKNHYATNRAMATLFKKEFPETNIASVCQFVFLWLHEYAADYLNDDSVRN